MSAPYIVTAQGIAYTVVYDSAIPYDACVTGSLIDEAAGTPLLVAPSISVDRPGILVNLASGGFFALACYVDLVFPQLATTAYHFTLTIAAPNYRSQSVVVGIPAGSVLPLVLPPIAMRALPVRLQGRVVADVNRAPIAGATVNVTTANITALRTPAYFDHAAGVTVAAVTLTPVGAATQLATAALGALSSITVTSAAGIAAGQVLQIGPDINADFGVVASVDAASGAVVLLNAINSSFPAGAPVQPVAIAPAGPSASLFRDVNAGDGLLLLAGPLVASAIEIADGPNTEYHVTAATTAVDGYYHLNGIGGVVSIDLTAQAAGFADLTHTLAVAYGNSVNVVDFRLQP
jgi:hypothetical protein